MLNAGRASLDSELRLIHGRTVHRHEAYWPASVAAPGCRVVQTPLWEDAREAEKLDSEARAAARRVESFSVAGR